jgi:hypothetical protein
MLAAAATVTPGARSAVPSAALRRVTTGLAVAGQTARRGQSPAHSPAEVLALVVLPVSVHAIALGHFALFRSSSGLRLGAGVPEARP